MLRTLVKWLTVNVVLVTLLFLFLTGDHVGPTSSQPEAEAAMESRPQEGRVSPPQSPRVVKLDGTPVDLSEVMERTHFSFQALNDGFAGGDVTYGVRVADDAITMTAHDVERANYSRPLTLRTASIGNTSLATSRTLPYERAEEGHLSRAYDDGISEYLRNTKEGLVQSWSFEERPEAAGDLWVRVEVQGQEYVGLTDSGLHFRDASSGLGFSYSHATWIDAAGIKTPISVRYEDEQILLRIPAELLKTSTFPTVLDPTIGAEYAMDAPILGPAVDLQRAPVVANSGQPGYEFLVVWQDRRRSLDLTFDIFAVHVDGVGTIREPVGFGITDPNVASDETQPAILYHGPNYTIAYTSNEFGNQRILARLIDARATLPLPGVTDISQDLTNNCTDPTIAHVASNQIGPTFLFAWVRTPASQNSAIFGAMDVGGLSAPFAIYSVAGVNAFAPAASGQQQLNSPRYLVTWHANYPSVNNIRGMILEANGTLVGTHFAITTETQKHALNPSVGTFGGLGAPGNGWIVAWEKNIGTALNPNINVYAKYVNPSTGALGAQVDISTAAGNQRLPAIGGLGPSGTQAIVAWTDFRSIPVRTRGTRVNVSGTDTLTIVDGPASTGSINMSGNPEDATPSVSSDGFLHLYFSVWGDQRNGAYSDIYGAFIPWSTPANASVSNFLISKSANEQTAPAIAKCNNHYLVAWSDTRNGYSNPDIFASLLDSTGAVVVSNIQISVATGFQDAPAIACNGSNFFVVWTDERNGNPDIYGNGVDSTTGALLNGPTGIPIATTPEIDTAPAIAFDGVTTTPSYWVVWQWNTTRVRGQRIDKNGVLLGATIDISPNDSTVAATPDIDFDGANFLVVWQFTNAQGGPSDIVVVGSGNSGESIPEILATGCDPAAAWAGASRPRCLVRIDGPSRCSRRPRSRTRSTIAAARSSSCSTAPQVSGCLFDVKMIERIA